MVQVKKSETYDMLNNELFDNKKLLFFPTIEPFICDYIVYWFCYCLYWFLHLMDVLSPYPAGFP